MLPRVVTASASATASVGAIAAVILFAQSSAPSVRAAPGDPIGILLAAGDIAECKPGNPKGRPADGFKQEETAALLGKEIADATMRNIPIRVLALGDLAYRSGTTDEFENCFHKSWGQHVKVMLPVPGNHEYGSTDAAPYFAYFEKNDRKMVLENSPAGGPKAGYYALNFPAPEELSSSEIKPWRLIALNSRKGKPPPPQLDWLKQDLKSNGQRCVLAFAHYFAFSSSRHGHEPPDFQRADKKNAKKVPKPDPPYGGYPQRAACARGVVAPFRARSRLRTVQAPGCDGHCGQRWLAIVHRRNRRRHVLQRALHDAMAEFREAPGEVARRPEARIIRNPLSLAICSD